jgi:hypothetical protein
MSPFVLDSKSNKVILRWILRIFIYTNLLAMVVLPLILNTFDQYKIGKFFGILAVFAFLTSQIPGLFRRYSLQGIFKQVGNLLMYPRAHIGVLMFLLATVHYQLTFILPTVRTIEYGFKTPEPFAVFGIMAFYLCFPLFVTSNDWSKKKLKQNWSKLHKLTYFILWVIFIHVAMVGKPLISGIIIFFGIIQVGSFVYARNLKAQKAS